MAFTPRLLADGRVCCSSPSALCDPCKAAARRADLGLGANQPPDGYAIALAGKALRDETTPTTTDRNIPPDPYAPGIAALRKGFR